MIQFEVGKSYALHLPAKDGNGNTTFLTDIFTVTRRTPCYLTFSHISSYGTKMPHCRCKIFTSDTRGEFVHATAFFCLYADSYIDDDSQPNENATSEITPASDNNNATASQPAIVATVQSNTTALQKIKCPYDYDISAMSPNTGPITPSAVKKSALLEVLQPESLYMDNSFSDAPGDNSCPDQDIPESHEPDAIPADNPGFTIVPSEHITRPDYATYPESITDECPYTTVYACDFPENHTHAAVVPYAEAAPIRKIFRLIAIFLRFWLAMHPTPSLQPLDDFPDGLFTHYPTRNAPRKKLRRAHFEVGYSYSASCYSPSNGLQSFTFLVTGRVVYEDTYDKTKGVFLFVTCNSPDNHDFEGRGIVRVHNDHGVEVYDYRKGYEMGCGWQVFSFRADKRDNIPYSFKDTTPSEPNYIPCGHCTRFISREFLNYSDNPDSVQPVHTEINNITPKPKPQPRKQESRKPESATDSEHKLIDTTNLHFHERRAALDHNAAVISSCMFHEAVISMLLKISPAAIIQLGFHMGLFIAKPKGKKISIAEAFAKRLIERRDLHAVKSASVHTHTAQQTSINTAGIPDNVKFFETKHRQLAFMFTDELVFTD